MEEHADELALLETLDMGKPIRDSRRVDVPLAAETIAYYGEAIDKVYDEIAPTESSSVVMIVREPLGVVAAVVPWNFPLLMASWKLGPALATGNSVVLKPAEQSSLTALKLAELAAEAGLPDGVLQVVPGLRRDGGPRARPASRRRHGRVHRLDRGGQALPALQRRVEHEAARARVRRQVAERRLSRLRRSRRRRAGGGLGRLLQPGRGLQCRLAAARARGHPGRVRRARSEGQLAASGPAIRSIPATKMGAIVDDRQLERVLGYVETGKQEGAGLLLGGDQTLIETGGYYVEPTVFGEVSNDMTIARDEIFGPVMSVISFKDEAEAIAIANDTVYGLAAAIWTDDVNRAHRAARALRAGVVWVNTFDAGRHHVAVRRFQAVRLRA